MKKIKTFRCPRCGYESKQGKWVEAMWHKCRYRTTKLQLVEELRSIRSELQDINTELESANDQLKERITNAA